MKVATRPAAFSICSLRASLPPSVCLPVCAVCLSVLPVIRQIMSTRTQLLAASQGRPQRSPCG